MVTYTYTGKLADFGAAPFPNAMPWVWIAPEHDAFGPEGGVHPARDIPVGVRDNGAFQVDLVASADLKPETRYSLRCEWLTADGVSRGWAQLDFTAAIGGGPIADMKDATVTRVWWAESPPPVQRAGIYWVHPVTGDVKEWM